MFNQSINEDKWQIFNLERKFYLLLTDLGFDTLEKQGYELDRRTKLLGENGSRIVLTFRDILKYFGDCDFSSNENLPFKNPFYSEITTQKPTIQYHFYTAKWIRESPKHPAIHQEYDNDTKELRLYIYKNYSSADPIIYLEDGDIIELDNETGRWHVI